MDFNLKGNNSEAITTPKHKDIYPSRINKIRKSTLLKTVNTE